MPLRGGRAVLGALVLAVSVVAAWWLWLGRDTTYQVDPATHVSSGPYEAWQVAGCGITLVGLVVPAALLLPKWAAIVFSVVPFVAASAVNAAATDRTGLFAAGLHTHPRGGRCRD